MSGKKFDSFVLFMMCRYYLYKLLPSRIVDFSGMTSYIYWHLICHQIFNNYGQLHNPQTTLGQPSVEKLSSDQQYNDLELFGTVMGFSPMKLLTQYLS